MRFLSIIALVAVTAAQNCVPVFQDKVLNCGTASDSLQVSSVNLTPETPKRGDTITLAVTGDLKTTVPAGTVTYTAEYNGVVVRKVTKDICESGKCPFAQGQNTLTKSFAIPATIPAGDYVINIVSNDASGAQISHLRGLVNLQ